jgi:large subunit ribosomal protein L17
MAHRRAGRKLGRTSAQRSALFDQLITELFKSERIRTTEAKAKAIRGRAERLIALSTRGDLHSRRLIMRTVRDRAVVDKLLHVIGPDMEDRPGGYTRIVRLGPRRGDAAPMVYLELVEK